MTSKEEPNFKPNDKIKYAHAAVLEQIGAPLAIKKIELPELLEGQVLVKILFSGVCRSQLMEMSGGRGEDKWLPHLLGHEGSGVVVSIGPNVTKVSPGDEVILGWIQGNGLNAPGAKYLCDGRVINSGRVTTFSNYSVVAENRLVKKPSNIALDVAVLFGCALPTGAGMALNEIAPKQDESILILGLGGIGLSALITLKALGLKKLVAADVSNDKLAFAKRLGVDQVFNPLDGDFRSNISKIIEGGFDACIESGGTVHSIELGYSLIRKGGGRLLFASHPPEGEQIKLSPHDLISGKQIAGSWGGQAQPDRDVPRMAELFVKSDAPLEALLTKRYPLAQINTALEDLRLGQVFRPLIAMTHQ
jgi:S-(hydroxymethyl)glutathione dehydrogenase/alcohol dehydrogenase